MSAEQHAAHAPPLDLDALERSVVSEPPDLYADEVWGLLTEVRALRADQERLRMLLAAARAALAHYADEGNWRRSSPRTYCGEVAANGCDVARAALGQEVA